VVLQLRGHGGSEEQVLTGQVNPCRVEILTGCGTLVPVSCYRAIGGYDERWCPQYHGDAEFVLRARRHGYQCLVDIEAIIWNDAHNTCMDQNVFSRRSPWFWKPVWAIHQRYCPRRYLPVSLYHYYVPVIHGRFPHISSLMSKLAARLRRKVSGRRRAAA
jgi:GT2 family glycosyltransferase